VLDELLAAPWTIRCALLVLAAALSISVVTDLRRRLIPNEVTIPALALVIGLFGATGGWPLVQNCLVGMAAFTQTGFDGAMMQMFNHGTITSMLFILVGVLYDRAHTREIGKFGGMATQMPKYAAFFNSSHPQLSDIARARFRRISVHRAMPRLRFRSLWKRVGDR